MVPVPEDQLPVVLPTDIEFTGKGESPLAKDPNFVRYRHVRNAAALQSARRIDGWMDGFQLVLYALR